MSDRHVMVIEGKVRKKKKAVKTTKKSSAIGRQLRSVKRQAWNVLGAIGCFAVIVWLVQLIWK
jgi:hypothetical protein